MKISESELDLHPIKIVRDILEAKYPPYTQLVFSKYKYVPKSLIDTRQYYYPVISELYQFLLKQLDSLQEGEDLAFHSRITISDSHLLMLDMKYNTYDRLFLEEVMREFKIQNSYIYKTGRSFHVYFDKVEQDLIKFLGTILVLDKTEDQVDQRWIGHRLLTKSLTLRWSCCNPHYSQYPELVEVISLG